MKTALPLCLGLMLIGSAHAQVLRGRSGGGEHGGRTQPRVETSRSDHGGGHVYHHSGGHARHDGGYTRHEGGHARHDAGHNRSYSGHYQHHYYPSYRGSHVGFHVPFSYNYPRYGYYPSYPSYSYYGGYGAGYPYYGSYGYDDDYGRGSTAANGLVLGALAGGIIGNNSGAFRHDAWRGAAWGAGVGWILGAIADSNRRVATPPQQYVVPQQVVPAQPAPQQVTIINNYYQSSTPMSGANALFGRN